MNDYDNIKVLVATCGAWHLPRSARAFEQRGALASLWVTEKNSTSLPADKFRRCFPFALAMQPFYRWMPDIWAERAFYKLFPIWRAWVRAQPFPPCNVVQAIHGYATEFFDFADAHPGVLRVVDCPNSHPMTAYGIWQRECDLWCPGHKVPVPQWLFARQHREFERADLIIVPSKFCRESMVLNGIPSEKVFVNPYGVDTSVFKPRTEIPLKPKFVSTGSICVRKGHQYLFRAFQKVKQQVPDAELVCAGAYRDDFCKERPKWEGSFTHYNHLPHTELAALLRTSTAFVLPSQEEGFARVQTEALACGLPVIGTHEGGATTVMEDGVEGFIVRGRDPDDIAAAMVRLAQDKQMNRRMGDAAYRKGAVRNTWQDYGDRLLAEYVNRLGERRAPVPAERENSPIGVHH